MPTYTCRSLPVGERGEAERFSADIVRHGRWRPSQYDPAMLGWRAEWSARFQYNQGHD